nr:ribosomal-processing cysteine protease Prp [Gelria sp. Kuro-4]
MSIQRRVRTGITGFSVAGHAGTAPKGRDIVCAGVSALTQAAVLGLEEHLGLVPQVTVREGFLSCRLGEPGKKADAAQAILEAMALGLEAMAEEYPDRIRVEEVLE